MMALTIHQPYAQLIADGHKTIETRRWQTNYRGALLITASARTNPDNLPSGCTICLVDLIDCRPIAAGDHHHALCDCYLDEFAWVLANPRQLSNHPIMGRQRLWRPAPEIITRLA